MDSIFHLLLIDDDELDRQAVTRVLRRSSKSYAIVQASTAAAGLHLAATQLFDAILLDYRLPDQDGLEVLKLLRGGQFEDVAVIMLSHQEDDDLADLCIEAGAQDFLLKAEVNDRNLVRAVRHAKQHHLIESALRHSREQLRQLSERDALTGLVNRRGFETSLNAAMARAQRSKERLAVLLLDLDDFKNINDTLGHDAGDAVLIQIARLLSATIRGSDLLCRLGGDEFVVLMPDIEGEDQAVLLADRIIARLQEPILIGACDHLVTTSIGIAVLDACTENNTLDLLKCADVAMYRAKQDGRNRWQFYSTALQETVLARAGIRRDMHKALERGEFKVYYQAQINSSDGSLCGMEALVRWQHPHLGVLAPAAFMAVAEETGLIVDIGNWVLLEACVQLRQWQERLPAMCAELTLAVNVSAAQIRQDGLCHTVSRALAQSAIGANSLELEITESTLIEDTHKTAALLSAIVEQGVSLSLDDFGTGYSSLEHLRLFPIRILKIDRAFVSTVGAGIKSEQLLVAIIAFAKTLEMKVVAEGVETRQQADFCARNGCDLLQGYFYSRPVPAEEFEAKFLRVKKPQRAGNAVVWSSMSAMTQI